MYSSEDKLNFVQFAFAAVHFLYFIVYYGRYSTLNQKLAGIEKMRAAEVVDQQIVAASIASVQKKITSLRKRSFYPIGVIAAIHLIVLYFRLSDSLYYDDSSHYLKVLYIAAGSFAMILAGNFARGAQIFDPNKRFRGTTGRNW